MPLRLSGLVAAPHTPMREDESLALEVVERQAEHLARHGVRGVFVAGSTGEWSSLTTDERMRLAQRWSEVARGAGLALAVHVGHNCLDDARALAAHARDAGVDAIAALAPSYFKPRDVDELVEWCARIAERAPELPFYYYDIPALTGVALPVDRFLETARERIPSLAGVKYTNPDLVQLQRCVALAGGELDVLFGNDEILLAALPLGVAGAVGSTYNFAAPLYTRLIAAFRAGDLEAARSEQLRAVRMIEAIARHGYPAAAKAVMCLIGVDCGPARLPWVTLGAERRAALRADLEALGFFAWSGPG